MRKAQQLKERLRRVGALEEENRLERVVVEPTVEIQREAFKTHREAMRHLHRRHELRRHTLRKKKILQKKCSTQAENPAEEKILQRRGKLQEEILQLRAQR